MGSEEPYPSSPPPLPPNLHVCIPYMIIWPHTGSHSGPEEGGDTDGKEDGVTGETLESSVEENKVFILQHICNSHDPLHIVLTVLLSIYNIYQ